MIALSPEIITTIVTVVVAVGGMVTYLERRLAGIDRKFERVEDKIERVEDRVQGVDDKVFALATGLKPIIEQAQRSEAG